MERKLEAEIAEETDPDIEKRKLEEGLV